MEGFERANITTMTDVLGKFFLVSRCIRSNPYLDCRGAPCDFFGICHFVIVGGVRVTVGVQSACGVLRALRREYRVESLENCGTIWSKVHKYRNTKEQRRKKKDPLAKKLNSRTPKGTT